MKKTKNIYPDLPPKWITSTLSPDDIRQQSVWIMLTNGQKKQERFEIEDVNSRGEMLVRIDYGWNPSPGTISFASYRVTQQDFDSWIADRAVVLKV
jgi:hypothetical protein